METTERGTWDDVSDADPATDTPSTRWQRLLTPSKLVWHVAALTLVLLALLPIIDNGAVAFPDEGVYSAQVRNLSDGSWYGERSAPEIDRTGRFDPNLGVIVDGKSIPYGTHPLYPLTLLPGFLAGGTTGMLIVSIAGSVLAALSAALLARRLKPSYAVPALWLAGIGTPLLFDGYLVMGHSLVAACCGWLVLSVTAAVDDRRWWASAGAAALTVALVALRSEGLIVAASVGVVVGLAALAIPRRRSMDWPAAFLGGAIVVLAGATYLVNGVIGRSLTERGEVGSTSFDTASKGGDPIEAAWISLFQPWGHAISATPAVVLLVVAVVLAAFALRVPKVPKVLPVALLAMAAVAGVVTLFQAPQLINGLFAVAPVLVFGVVFLHWRDRDDRLIVRLAGVCALSTALLLVTVYANPGAQWGGRFFHVLLPLLVPLTILGLDRAFAPLARAERRAALACLVVATLALSTLSLRANVEMRRTSEGMVTAVAAAVERGDADSTLVLVVRLTPDGLSRIFWESDHRRALLALPDPGLFLDLVGGARVDDVHRLIVISELRPPVFGQLVGARLTAGPWSLGEVGQVGDSGMYLYEFVPKEI